MTKVLVFDTETTADEIQKFKFGFYRYGSWDGEKFELETEGLFYDESLSQTEMDTLHSCVDSFNRNDQAPGPVEFINLNLFRERYLYNRVYKERAHLVGFNLPFDLSRIAFDVREARHPRFRGGFSYILWKVDDGSNGGRGRPNTFRPRLLVRMLDSKKSFIEFGNSNRNTIGNSGTFIDLRTLAFSLTNRGHTLASACDAFSVTHSKLETDEHGRITTNYVNYARRDVQATCELYVRTMQEFQKHPIRLQAAKAYSPASMSKAYFRAMAIPQPLDRANISDDILGYCMTAFYGARSECRIRRLPVPVALVDFTSMYPTVNSLLNNWDLLTGEKIYARDSTSNVRQMLETIGLEDCFNRAQWRHFRGIAKVRPTADILPVRSRYGKNGWNIGVNYYSSNESQWFAIPDLIASKILTGRAPTIEQAYSFDSTGHLDGLRETRFAGRVPFSPSEDFFTFVVDERSRFAKSDRANEFLKVLANAGCYGIFAEINREETTIDSDLRLFGAEPWVSTSRRTENPGAYSFPPISTVITSSARLMLAMLERCVTDRNGRWAFTDTDSMAIVANHDGETLSDSTRALSFSEVDDIRHQFNTLNPYRRVPDLLKTEYQGWCYAISSKRYCLYRYSDRDDSRPNASRITIDKYSSHGLGHLINPTDLDGDSENRDWISAVWRYIIEGASEPTWIDRPAISRYAVTQMSLLRSFRKFNHNRTYSETVKPSNFILIGHGAKFQPSIPGRIVPIRSYERDPEKWLSKPWINKYDDRQLKVATYNGEGDIEAGTFYLKSYRDVLSEYALHPEDKFCTESGTPCYPSYVGRLERVHIRSLGFVYLGKEANEIEPVQLGLISADEVTALYEMIGYKWHILYPLLKASLGHLTHSEIARSCGMTTGTVKKLLNGRAPTSDHLRKITRVACLIACDQLNRTYDDNEDPVKILTEWTDNRFTITETEDTQ